MKKELTTIFTAQVTLINRNIDDEYMNSVLAIADEYKQAVVERLKDVFNADDVTVNVQFFPMDEKEKK